jgi:uncharacterized protein YbaA (DUF1428 family)
MTYLDGYVIPVAKGKRDAFVEQANRMDRFFLDHGALKVVESWGADIAPGKTTDFRQAVAAGDDEDVVFSFVAWPDKATRDAAMAKMESDERFTSEPMIFDGKRMIFGGFEPIVEHGSDGPFVQGFVIPVPEGRKEDYRQMAEDAWTFFLKYGANSVVEAWGEDVPHGKQTDFYRSVKAEAGEQIVFSYMTWPSAEAAEKAGAAMESDPDMKMPDDMPFDPRRMIFAGFEPVVTLEKVS